MSPDDLRKRKACQSCTRAKAKCSPFENRHDLCYRCQRLNKECVFEDTIRKRGPKTRSRVKQLEQRVDTLIDLLAANGHSTNTTQPTSSGPAEVNHVEQADPTRWSVNLEGNTRSQPPYVTPVETPDSNNADARSSKAYDPVEAGIISEDDATSLLNKFRESFMSSFPFVVIPPSTDAKALRMQHPFLFLSVVAVTIYDIPAKQRILADEFKNQIAIRIIGNSQKSVEILQGLLVHAGWYHFFYHPEKQQLAVIIQLCVAMIQDLGLSKNPKEKSRRMVLDNNFGPVLNSERSSAEKRAFLGTFYLASAFAQAWRKRGTIRHTKYMAQCCQFLAQGQEYPSDALITPLVQISELACRVNDFFSYDDIENADVKGDMMLQMSTANFESEVERISTSIPANIRRSNITLHLNFCLLDLWIHECGIHTSLWGSPLRPNGSSISPTRVKTLYRCISAIKSYLNTLIATPEPSLHHLAFPTWAAWFYSIIVACKLVFLEDNERDAQTDLEPTFREINNIITEDTFSKDAFMNKHAAGEACPLPSQMNIPAAWDPVTVAREAEVHNLFDRLVKKMEFTVPTDPDAWQNEKLCDPLFPIICLQRSLLHGFTKRMEEHLARTSNADPNNSADASSPISSSQRDVANVVDQAEPQQSQQRPSTTTPPQTQYLRQMLRDHPVPLIDQLQFNTLNFDSIAMPDPVQPPQGMYDDWLWDIVMDDFTIPGI